MSHTRPRPRFCFEEPVCNISLKSVWAFGRFLGHTLTYKRTILLVTLSKRISKLGSVCNLPVMYDVVSSDRNPHYTPVTKLPPAPAIRYRVAVIRHQLFANWWVYLTRWSSLDLEIQQCHRSPVKQTVDNVLSHHSLDCNETIQREIGRLAVWRGIKKIQSSRLIN